MDKATNCECCSLVCAEKSTEANKACIKCEICASWHGYINGLCSVCHKFKSGILYDKLIKEEQEKIMNEGASGMNNVGASGINNVIKSKSLNYGTMHHNESIGIKIKTWNETIEPAIVEQKIISDDNYKLLLDYAKNKKNKKIGHNQLTKIVDFARENKMLLWKHVIEIFPLLLNNDDQDFQIEHILCHRLFDKWNIEVAIMSAGFCYYNPLFTLGYG